MPFVQPVEALRASKLRLGRARAQGVPAILFGVAAIVFAAGFTRALAIAAPILPETLREAKALFEATRPEQRSLKATS